MKKLPHSSTGRFSSWEETKVHWEKDEAQKDDQHFPQNSVLQRDRYGKVTHKEGPLRQIQQEGETK